MGFNSAFKGLILSDLSYRRDVNQILALLACYAALARSYRRFGATHRSHFQGRRDDRKFVLKRRLTTGRRCVTCQKNKHLFKIFAEYNQQDAT